MFNYLIEEEYEEDFDPGADDDSSTTSVKRRKKSISRKAFEIITPWDDDEWERRQRERKEKEEMETNKKNKSIPRMAYEAITPWDDDEVGQRKRSFPAKKKRSKKTLTFRQTFLYQMVEHVSQASKVSLAVVAADCISLMGKLMGYSHSLMNNFSRIFSKVAYTGWVTRRFQTLKRYMIHRTLASDQGEE